MPPYVWFLNTFHFLLYRSTAVQHASLTSVFFAFLILCFFLCKYHVWWSRPALSPDVSRFLCSLDGFVFLRPSPLLTHQFLLILTFASPQRKDLKIRPLLAALDRGGVSSACYCRRELFGGTEEDRKSKVRRFWKILLKDLGSLQFLQWGRGRENVIKPSPSQSGFEFHISAVYENLFPLSRLTEARKKWDSWSLSKISISSFKSWCCLIDQLWAHKHKK